MDTKLIELSELLCTIQDMQEKIQLQIIELEQSYFCYTEVAQGRYSKARINCSIASDYSNHICEAIEEAKEAVESLVTESVKAQKGGAA